MVGQCGLFYTKNRKKSHFYPKGVLVKKLINLKLPLQCRGMTRATELGAERG